MYSLPCLLLLALGGDPLPVATDALSEPTSAIVPALAGLHAEDDGIWSRLGFYGNGRLRAEETFDQPNGEDRFRGRLRARFGATYRILPDLTAEARITTTSGDANNPHWDFGRGDGFNGSDLALDRFFVNWQACEDLSVRAGKLPHAFAGPPVYGELVWDGDVHPSGLTATWGPGKRDGVGYDVRGAGYVALENSGGSDPAMLGMQGNLYMDGESSHLHLSTSLQHWSGLRGGGGVPGNQGNTDVMGKFLTLEGFAAATLDGGPLEHTTGFVQLMHNLDDEVGEEDGIALGVLLGTSRQEGAFNVFATYYDVDANAVFSPPAQDDTPIAGTGIGTGMTGIIAGGEYWVSDNLSLRLWALTSDADAADDPVRLRFDVNFSVR